MPINLEGASAFCKDCGKEIAQGAAHIEVAVHEGVSLLRGRLIVLAGNHHAKFRSVVVNNEAATKRHCDMIIYDRGRLVGECLVTSHGSVSRIKLQDQEIIHEFEQELLSLRQEGARRSREENEGRSKE